jgi:hypothetical protein
MTWEKLGLLGLISSDDRTTNLVGRFYGVLSVAGNGLARSGVAMAVRWRWWAPRNEPE